MKAYIYRDYTEHPRCQAIKGDGDQCRNIALEMTGACHVRSHQSQQDRARKFREARTNETSGVSA